MKKKYSITLLEIMIVIFLIGLIGSVIGYNMKGSLDEGRVFRTEQAAAQIYDILTMEIAKGYPMETVVNHREKFLENSGLVKDPKKLLKDGWGEEFVFTSKGKEDFTISSRKYREHKSKKVSKLGLGLHGKDAGVLQGKDEEVHSN